MCEGPAGETEVLIVGGGPGGSTAAALLAQQGVQVTLLERARFPRYHIGESLLPSLLPLLDLLGARERVEALGFVRKRGALYDWGGQQWSLSFGELGDTEYSFQVVRSDFDQALLEHARAQGVRVWEGVGVREIEFRAGRAVAAAWVSKDGTCGRTVFRQVVDASGRAGVLAARHLRTRRFHDAFRNVAVWGYWRGASALEGAPPGAICVLSLPDHGWLWAIPLHDGTLSVGLVTDKESFAASRASGVGVDALYSEKIKQSEALNRILHAAELVTPLKVESDYSYVAERFCGPGYFLAGDAACFLDPLLSTGVHLAMYSGMLTAACLASLHRRDVSEQQAHAFYQGAYRHAYERLLVLVGAFYDIHQGRDAQFRRAQALSHRDQRGLRLHESFLNIISGIEDLHDAQDTAVAQAFTSLRRPMPGHRPVGLGGHGATAMTPWPTTPERSVAGLRLTVHPHLGLSRR